MKIELIAHTQLSKNFREEIKNAVQDYDTTDGQIIALTAIRNCYSYLPPTQIIVKQAKQYFGRKAKDGGSDNDAMRLIRQIIHSGHKSTVEHLSFTFAIEGVSRTLLAQLTRHRVGFSYSVESQRYTKMGTEDKSGGAHFYIPEEVRKDSDALAIYKMALNQAQHNYDTLRALGISPQEARELFPNATLTNIVMTCNLRSLLDFYSKRQHGKGAQTEIADLAESLRQEVVKVEPWTDQFFKETK